MLSVNLNSMGDVQKQLSERFRALRILRDLSRKTLAEMSGVPEPSIKRFELTGEISMRSLLCLAHALDVLGQFEQLFTLPAARSLDEIESREGHLENAKKKRGRR